MIFKKIISRLILCQMPRRVAAQRSVLSPYPGVYLLLVAYSFRTSSVSQTPQIPISLLAPERTATTILPEVYISDSLAQPHWSYKPMNAMASGHCTKLHIAPPRKFTPRFLVQEQRFRGCFCAITCSSYPEKLRGLASRSGQWDSEIRRRPFHSATPNAFLTSDFSHSTSISQ